MLNIGVVGKMGFDGDIPMIDRHNPATAAKVFYRLFNARCGPARAAEHITYLKGQHYVSLPFVLPCLMRVGIHLVI
jgi:hypothetical protein